MRQHTSAYKSASAYACVSIRQHIRARRSCRLRMRQHTSAHTSSSKLSHTHASAYVSI
jgi:hypothetical protein